MFGIADKFFGGGLLDDEAGVHDQDLIGEVARRRQIVRHIQKADALFVAQPRHQIQDAQADRHIQHGNRLVGQDDLWLGRQCAGDGDALALAAAELVRIFLDEFVHRRQRDHREEFFQLVAQVLSAARFAVDLQRALDGVAGAVHGVEAAERVLEDHLHLRPIAQHGFASALGEHRLAIVEDLAGCGLVQARQHAYDRALAAAAFAHQSDHMPAKELEARALNGFDAAAGESAAGVEVFAQVARFEDGLLVFSWLAHDAVSASLMRWQATSR